ncbi:MAG: 50S ribosomal protein L19, partial [Phycisphaerae bacterium]
KLYYLRGLSGKAARIKEKLSSGAAPEAEAEAPAAQQ